MKNLLQRIWQRVRYRCWQFRQVLLPKIDPQIWHEAMLFAPAAWRPHLKKLRLSERAHVIRLYTAIKQDSSLAEPERESLLRLALAHDIGKGVTRHSIFFKVAKVLFPISNGAHCLAGAKLLRQLKADNELVRRVLRHHRKQPSDMLLQKFQNFDDRL